MPAHGARRGRGRAAGQFGGGPAPARIDPRQRGVGPADPGRPGARGRYPGRLARHQHQARTLPPALHAGEPAGLCDVEPALHELPLRDRPGSGQGRPGRRLCPGLPASSRGIDLGDHEAPGEDRAREGLHRRERRLISIQVNQVNWGTSSRR